MFSGRYVSRSPTRILRAGIELPVGLEPASERPGERRGRGSRRQPLAGGAPQPPVPRGPEPRSPAQQRVADLESLGRAAQPPVRRAQPQRANAQATSKGRQARREREDPLRPILRIAAEELVTAVAGEDDLHVAGGELRQEEQRDLRGLGDRLVAKPREARERDTKSP